MKPYPHSSIAPSLCFLVLLAASAGGCNSTETGNPAKENPGPGPGTPLNLELGLRGPVTGIDVPGAQGAITGLWLQVSEVEFVTCAGESTASEGPSSGENLTSRQTLPVTAPNDPVCAIVVRTIPLDLSRNQGLPAVGVGQGAVVEGLDFLGAPFSAVVPERITSVLTPVSTNLTLSESETLRLTISDDLLLEPVSAYGTAGAANQLNVYDSSNAPDLVDAMANQLNLAFTLERPGADPTQAPERLATSTMTWSDVDDLLCASECALQDRTSCSSVPCDTQACLSRLMDPICGESFRDALHCRVGMNPGEYSCIDGTLSVLNSHCDLPESTYGSCGGQ